MASSEDAESERDTDYRVPALQRGLSILQMFGARQRTLGSQEIAERLGVSVSAIYRIVHTLNEMGYLRKVAKNTYELGPQVVSDGFAYLASRDLVDIAQPHLNALRDRTSLSCHLSIREQTDSLYIYRAFAAQRLSVNIPIGTRIPCHCTAMGRILLTGLSPMALDSLYLHVRLDDYPPPAPKTLPELQQTIDEDRSRGWVLHRSDYSTAIACGIHDHLGDVVAAINLSGPEAVMDNPQARERFLHELQHTAQAISRELGAA
ncbi:IclR family transcriptional regulator [Stutzerimonas stutzeri]|uniref:IclR family transcriptional regulator n=2 Tax=Stutzerimonas stutzeri group TaxID=136846 RepID=A0A2N8T6P6_STUST|nr:MULTISPECIES: IclR family transcriptional regulator [Stutzerimonas stutzeri group]MCQ4323459.1 IclR family transcriptional regulator [Stutzerimonas stutzeri]PNG10447.1 IclR family transcriptional regulator [Stutzerimonas stutzeri]WAE54198.1 IclR family transcriptional regulator [Stutzerimonas frequens]